MQGDDCIQNEALHLSKTRSYSRPRYIICLESGLIPARDQGHRQVLNFLHYILQQPRNSVLCRIFETRLKNPTKEYWASAATIIVVKYDMKLNIEEIQTMKSGQKTKNIWWTNSKGKENGILMRYYSLQMADYLLPESNLNTTDKIE